MKYFQLFRVTGVASSVAYDSGLKSTETEKKRLISCHVEVEKYAGDEICNVQGWHERAKVFELPEKLFSSELNNATVQAVAGQKRNSVPVDLDIPTGEAFKVAIMCAATAIDFRGAYEYEIVE